MKKLISILSLFTIGLALADTPPPGTVKAKMFSGDGNTAITATGSALNVNVVSGGGGAQLVNQGTGGSDPWVMAVTSSVLPANACKESGGYLQSIDTKLTNPLPVSGTLTCNVGTGTQPVSGTFWQATQPVSLASLPALATGANTIGAVNINGTVPISGTITATNSANGATGSSVPAQATLVGGTNSGTLRALKVASDGTLTVDGSASTQPVSGTFWQATQPVSGTFWQATQPVSAASLPLPAGAATDTNQATEISSLATIATNTTNAGTPTVSGTVTANQGTPGVGAWPVLAAQAGTWNITNVSGTVSLPTGAATESTLSTLNTKTPSLGQALAAGSVPVVLTASQLSTLTPLSSVTVSGTVTANAGTGTFTVDGSGHTQPVSGTFWQATQPVSAAALPLPSGAATETTLASIDAKTPALGQALAAASTPVVLTAAQVSTLTPLSTVTANAGSGTFATSLATLPALTAGSALIGKVGIDQTTPGTTNGVQVNAALPAGSNVIGHVIADTGSTTAVTSLPALPAGSNVIGHVIVDTAPTTAVSQSGTWTVQPGNTANTTAWLVNSVPKTPTATTVTQAAITIGTSAVRLTVSGSAPAATRVLMMAQLLSTSTAACFLGSSGVTSSSTGRGVQMFAGQTYTFNNDAGDYYAICDASSQTFFVTEQQ
jgi:hypothetical protein